MTPSRLTGLILIVTFSMLALPPAHAADKPPVPVVDNGTPPLPEERVTELFKKIDHGEQIPVKDLHQALCGPQTTLRAYAARLLADSGNATSVPHLIHALTDESVHDGVSYPEAGMNTTRFWANRSLIKLTGQDFAYKWDAPLDQRNAAVLRWLTWYATIPQPTPKPAP